MALSRRDFLVSSSKVSLGVAALASFGSIVSLPAHAQNVDLDSLLAKGTLDEVALGKEDAPVTIVEYFSLTCGHCANFHNNTFKHLEETYIKTGKVRFILREFPLDPLAAAGAMLARCAPGDNAVAMIDLLLEKQRDWAYSNDPVSALFNYAKQAGFTQESFNACLTDQKLLDDISAVRERGGKEFGINSTPTFFVNGEKHVGALSSAEFDKILEPLLN